MLRAALLLALLALSSCGRARVLEAPPVSPVHAGPPPPRASAPLRGTRPATAAELRVVESLMRETETLRGLRFRAPVSVTIEDREAMQRYVLRALDEEQLARARRRYVALGALDPELDVRALLVSIMEEELIGYYDPREKRLAVRADVAQTLGAERGTLEQSVAWRATVVHELVHALQDQHFDLATAIAETRTTDADNAFGALVEGDATLAMLGYTAELSGESLGSLVSDPERVHALMSRPDEQLTEPLRRAPALVREPLLFRYRDGAAFCAALFRRDGWAQVDAAHRHPPESTRAIREPERYLSATKERPLPVPAASWLSALGLRVVDDDVLGGLELAALLEAPRLAASWRADRYLVLADRAGDASLWWIELASPGAARTVALRFAALGDPERRIARSGARLLVGRKLAPRTFEEALAWTRTYAAAPLGARATARKRADTRSDRLARAEARH